MGFSQEKGKYKKKEKTMHPAIPKTRQFHAFISKEKKQLLCKIFSNSEETVIVN